MAFQTGTDLTAYWWRKDNEHPEEACQPVAQPGDRCPVCGKDGLAYDGLFVLTCPTCGHVAEHGAFT